MGVFDSLEKKLEGAVQGAFARAFKGDVQPVEITARIHRELDAQAKLLPGDRKLVPNDFTVSLSTHDHERLATYAETLNSEIIPEISKYAANNGYVFNGPIIIAYVRDEKLPIGKFTVTSRASAGVTIEPQANVIVGRPSAPVEVPVAMPTPMPAPTPLPAPAPVAIPTPAPPAPEVVTIPAHPRPVAPQIPEPTVEPEIVEQQIYVTQPSSTLIMEINGVRHPLTPPGFIIGRGADADVRINDPGISRKHARVTVSGTGADQRITIEDLGSTNGITVNSQRVTAAVLLRGSRVEMGNTRITVIEADHV